MNISPLVSIIIPVYGVEDYIGHCIDSLLQQTYQNIELIFVDDNTQDRSIEIIKQKIKESQCLNRVVKYKILHHNINRGLSAARNTGISVSSGKYILHVDSDDWIDPSMVEHLVNKAESNDADVVICGYKAVREEGVTVNIPIEFKDKEIIIRKVLNKSIPGYMWGKLISKDIYINHRDAWPIEGINHGEDYATIPRLLYFSKKIEYLPLGLYYYNLTNQTSYTHNFSKKSMLSMLRADEILADFFKGKIPDSELDIMKLRTKTGMIKRGNPNLYKEISQLYIEEQKRSGKLLSVKDKLLLLCIGRGLDNILSKIIKRVLS